MKFLRIVAASASLIFIGSLSPEPVYASSLNATCSLEIDGTIYMNGRCYFSSDADSDYFSDLRLRVTCPNGVDASKASCTGAEQKVAEPGVFGYLFRDQGVASFCWNEGTMRKASPCFEKLRRSGACWSNPRAKSRYASSQVSNVKFCAWAE
jgi:hypothetical protein